MVGIQLILPSAWSAEISLEADHHHIKGFAHQARLEEVMGQLAEQTGFTIFVDEALLNAEVNFDIPTALPAEKAIKRIIHPHSHALVFSRIPDRSDIRIDQVRVFSKGSRNAHYIVMASGNGAITRQTSYSRADTSTPTTNTFSHSAVHAGTDGVRAYTRPPVESTTNSMGFTGFKFRSQNQRPDYRPSSSTMSKAYTRYRNERQSLEQRSQNNLLRTSQQQVLNLQYRYQQNRTQSIQQSTSQSTP